MSDCKPRMVAACDKTLVSSADAVPAQCPTFEVCLPFGGKLFSNGGCLNYTPGTPPPDGEYSKIVISNGCITELHLADIPLLTPTPCAATPAPCDDEGGGMPEPSPTVGNLFTLDASGRPLVRLTVQAGSGISVTGDGTVSNPLVLVNTQAQPEATVVVAGNAGIQVAGSGPGADPFRVSHAANLSGTYNGMTFDNFGHLTSYTPSGSSLFVTSIVAGDGIAVDMNPSTGVANISLAVPLDVYNGVWQFGGFDIELTRNRITRLTRSISVASGTYRLGNYDVQVNEYGSITDVVYIPPPPVDLTQVHTSASKFFPTNGDVSRSMDFVTARDSSFRITYVGRIPTGGINIFVDSLNVPGIVTDANTVPSRYDSLPAAVYAAGAHTVTATVAVADNFFTTPGFLDVTLVALAT